MSKLDECFQHNYRFCLYSDWTDILTNYLALCQYKNTAVLNTWFMHQLFVKISLTCALVSSRALFLLQQQTQ